MKKSNYFTVYIEQDENGIFIGSVPAVSGCHAEGRTQAEMMKNLQAVLRLCLRNTSKKGYERTKFVGIQNLEIDHA